MCWLLVVFESIMLHSILLGEEIWNLFPEKYMCLEADERSFLQDKHFKLRVLFCSNDEHLNGELYFSYGPWYVLLFMMIGMTDAGWFSCHWSDDVFNIEILFYKTSKAFDKFCWSIAILLVYHLCHRVICLAGRSSSVSGFIGLWRLIVLVVFLSFGWQHLFLDGMRRARMDSCLELLMSFFSCLFCSQKEQESSLDLVIVHD